MRLGRILAVGLVLLIAILICANEFMVWRVNLQIRARVAAIRAAGDPASIDDLAPNAVDETENGAEVMAALSPRLDEFSTEHGNFFDTPIGNKYELRTGHKLAATPEQLAAIEKILNKYPDIDAGLAVAAACNKYASTTDYSLAPGLLLQEQINKSIQPIRSASRFVVWRMEVLIAAKKQEEAAKLGISFLRLTRQYDNEPLIVSGLVGIAVRGTIVHPLYDALSAGPISAETHAALDQELALDDDPRRMVRALKTERAYSVSMISEMGTAVPNSGVAQSILVRMFGWTMQRHLVGVLDYYDEQLALAGKPWFDAHQQSGRTGAPVAAKFGPLAGTLVPSIESLSDAEARDIALLRSLRVFNAAAKFREESGHEMSGLSDLALPVDATTDPFSGKQLRTKQTKEGWIIYSVMLNGVDDGGDFKGLKDVGVAPLQHRATTQSENEEEGAQQEEEKPTVEGE